MATIHDIRSKTPRSNPSRSISQIKYIARHHSATTDGDFFVFWKTWNGVKGWGTGGYHEIILRDGSVQLCYDPTEVTNGVANHNTPTYHICVVGNGSFTAAQEKTFKERCLLAMNKFNVPVERVLGHKEFSGASTACPGIDMNVVRKSLKGNSIPASKGDLVQVSKGYLTEGDKGTQVKELQKDLNAVGNKLDVDGIYGAATFKAVTAFQKKYKLAADGVAGKKTITKLNDVIAEAKKPATKPKSFDYRVDVDGKRVGVFGDLSNIQKQVESAYKAGKEFIMAPKK